MPELPEVETARKLLIDALVGRKISAVDAQTDDIVFCGQSTEKIETAFQDQTITAIRRKGKYFGWEMESGTVVAGHLGMTGAILDLTPGAERAVHYRETRKDPPLGERPRFLKLWLETHDGRKVAFVDGRRLARIWVTESFDGDPRIQALGPDAHDDLPDLETFHRMVTRRKAPIKAVLLDQSFLAGIGNYLADEVLYQSGIAPARLGATLSPIETEALRSEIQSVVGHAVAVEADHERFPSTWLFHARWGGKSGQAEIDGHLLVREQIGGRTTAWAPTKQNPQTTGSAKMRRCLGRYDSYHLSRPSWAQSAHPKDQRRR